MNAQCTQCGLSLALPWSFCPHCGLAIAHEIYREPGPVEHQKSSMPGAFGGLMFGVIAAPILIIVGTLLCLTGLGALLGVPMILGAILAPLIAPLIGLGEHAVKCPSCATRMITVADSKLHYCPSCEKEFAVGEHQVAKAV